MRESPESLNDRTNDVNNRWGRTMVAIPLPKRIKLVIALRQLAPPESARYYAPMRNPVRIVHVSKRRLSRENSQTNPIRMLRE